MSMFINKLKSIKKFLPGKLNAFSLILLSIFNISLIICVSIFLISGCSDTSINNTNLQGTNSGQQGSDYKKNSVTNNKVSLEQEENLKEEGKSNNSETQGETSKDINSQQDQKDIENNKETQSPGNDSSNGKTGGTAQKEDDSNVAISESSNSGPEGEEIIIDLKPPQVQLEVVMGPQYAQDNNICYYRVRAEITGETYPQIKFNRDDSNGVWGENISQVNLFKDESFILVCNVQNSKGSASSSISVAWKDYSGQLSNTQTETMQAESETDYSNPANYFIDVNLSLQQVNVLYLGNLIKSMACSGGKPQTPTPLGTFETNQKIYYAFIPKFGQGAYYWTRFYGAYLFHSVPYDENKNLLTEELAKIGSPASHGCIRLYLEDAKWMYDTLPLGIEVNIHY